MGRIELRDGAGKVAPAPCRPSPCPHPLPNMGSSLTPSQAFGPSRPGLTVQWQQLSWSTGENFALPSLGNGWAKPVPFQLQGRPLTRSSSPVCQWWTQPILHPGAKSSGPSPAVLRMLVASTVSPEGVREGAGMAGSD